MDDQAAIERCQAANTDVFRHIVKQYRNRSDGNQTLLCHNSVVLAT